MLKPDDDDDDGGDDVFGVIVSQILFSRLKNPFSPHRWVGGGKVGEGKMTFRLPTSSS